ncbi:MAG: cell wall hydrolase [Rhodopseudomonas sp.]|nr:cell wall hydrolase [Rhodopseudomonas sp.]
MRSTALAFGALLIGLLPTSIGYQDLGALLVRQPGVTQRARAHFIASPFGTIHAATFSMPRPVGTAIPHPPVYALANFDPTDIAASIGALPLGDADAPLHFPTVNRGDKRDYLGHRARAPLPPLPPLLAIEPAPQTAIDSVLDRMAAAPKDGAAQQKNADRVYFEADPLGAQHKELAPWAPGEAPVIQGPVLQTPLANGPADPDIKMSALEPAKPGVVEGEGGVSVASKGEVTGVDKYPRSPAERLSLIGPMRERARAKAEKCLANAVYFEARDEPVRAQIAVAQVVLNRVFSPYYPNDVCAVIYQNAGRHLACQFTFACDGKSKAVTEPDAWTRAVRIAKDTLDGKLWMPDVAKSTHYHDDWAHPNWVGEMRRLDKLGGLIFYRPRNWGDGADEPRWGNAEATAREVKKL